MIPTKFRVLSLKVEGTSATKSEIIATLNADICLQETHEDLVPPKIPGMHLIIHRPSPVHGSAIYARDNHSTTWGYIETNTDGEAVEAFAAVKDLRLLYDAKDSTSFQSACWRRGYNPDLACISSKHYGNIEKSMGNPIPKTQHRPILIDGRLVIRPQKPQQRPRFNFWKANWEGFMSDIEQVIHSINPTPEEYDNFQTLVWKAARNNIPRGYRKTYIPGLAEPNKIQYEEYVQAFNEDPFAENTIELGEDLLTSISNVQKERWQEVITNIDMTHNSKKAWMTIKKLNSEKAPQSRIAAVTPNQVAHQLLLNGKPLIKERGHKKKMKMDISHIMQNSNTNLEPFTEEDLTTAISHLKHGKASGLDGITPEIVTHLGVNAREWLLSLLNKCATSLKIPKIWKRAKVVALLKPGKDSTSPKSYRPISLLCIIYKLYECMILARILPPVEEHLSVDQAGFRPGRSFCSQVLNLSQYIEDMFENKQITGAVFVDLMAAYDTVNHRALIFKAAQIVQNSTMVRIIESLLSNRRFHVEMDGKKSRWYIQNN
ncbi:hypothetical protein Pcinc_010617 [Petrolisthes cinctipes]|uniref:Reverse transcriptase domain-containing protein n=1 Tax=Petrolisthes cinctipes TaxID=88211 RepID=A0AAE1G2X9_PETCI|nr:hypothetical protein Pcinc_010617 [Petrolisthes cinctipes]